MDARHVRGAARFHLPVFHKLSSASERLGQLRLSEHPLLVAGGGARPDRLTAVYGINGQRTLLQMATRRAMESSKYALIAEYHYSFREGLTEGNDGERALRRVEQSMNVTDRQWVHTNCISRPQKDQLVEILHRWIPEQCRTSSRPGKPACPADILLQHPELAQRVIDEHDEIDCLVYPARLDFDRSAVVWVGTMRADPARIVNPKLLHLQEAEVSI